MKCSNCDCCNLISVHPMPFKGGQMLHSNDLNSVNTPEAWNFPWPHSNATPGPHYGPYSWFLCPISFRECFILPSSSPLSGVLSRFDGPNFQIWHPVLARIFLRFFLFPSLSSPSPSTLVVWYYIREVSFQHLTLPNRRHMYKLWANL